MGTEQKLVSMENLGMRVHIGPTVVIASFISTRDDPKGEHPKIDLKSKTMAVWLTTPKTVGNEVYDFIIGPDGTASAIAIRRSNGLPHIYSQEEGKEDTMIKITDIQKKMLTEFSNKPPDANVRLIHKAYFNGQLWENYTVLTLPGNENERNINEFSPFAGKRTLISGMKNRGLNFNLTGLWASRITDRSNLPFGRELPRKK